MRPRRSAKRDLGAACGKERVKVALGMADQRGTGTRNEMYVFYLTGCDRKGIQERPSA
jgi:hypothetical protein